MIPYPNIDPIIFSIGPFSLRWYSLAYLIGILGGFRLCKTSFKQVLQLSDDDIWNLMASTMIGILLGGRLGYILFYNFPFYLNNPFKILAVWEGGMSYHGGAIGAALAFILFAREHKKNSLAMLDLLGIGSTIGLGLGRLANFINGELYGRVTDVPWAMIFPQGGMLPRHPSQLYEACLEGGLLFIVLHRLHASKKLKTGQLFAIYVAGYGLIRGLLEFTREPDTQVGLFFNVISMGQLLSLVMVTLGIGLFVAIKRTHTSK